jgi:hypothetical protein
MIYFMAADFCGVKTMRLATMCGLVLAVLIGCDNRSTSSNATSPGNQSSQNASVPATMPTTRPAAVFTIDNKEIAFPAAKLVVTKKSTGVEAVLCSDDPPTAIEPTYRGNSFMIEMKLDIDDPADLTSTAWTFQAPKVAPQDSPNGIFLNGTGRELQPLDVKVTFTKQGDDIIASVDGKFLEFEAHDVAAPAETVGVSGKLDAVVSEPPH